LDCPHLGDAIDFHREMQNELLSIATSYPVVTIMGPRQSGKTTLAKSTFPEKAYVNLEAPDVRELAYIDPRGFLENFVLLELMCRARYTILGV